MRKSRKSQPYVPSGSTDLYRSASSRADTKELERIDQLFYSYSNKSSRVIEPEGIEALCSDVGVDYTDVRILMFAWKMKAERQGYFTLDEWRNGLKALKVDTISRLKKALPDLEKEARRPANFTEFYKFAFQYCLTEDRQKNIDIESTCELLSLVLRSEFYHQVDSIIEYLKSQTDYKVINMDQWMGILRFCKEVGFPGFTNYDEELAWPSMLDDFVDWYRSKKV